MYKVELKISSNNLIVQLSSSMQVCRDKSMSIGEQRQKESV